MDIEGIIAYHAAGCGYELGIKSGEGHGSFISIPDHSYVRNISP